MSSLYYPNLTMAFELPGFGSSKGRAQSPVGKPESRSDYQPAEKKGIAARPTPSHPPESTQDRYTALSAGQRPQRRPDVAGGLAVEVIKTPRLETQAIPTQGRTEAKATPLPERIPAGLSAPVRALAEAVLATNRNWERWSDIPRSIQQVISVYDIAHEQVYTTSGMPTSEIQKLRERSVLEFQRITQEIDTLRASGADITDRLVALLTQLQEREAQVAADVAALVFLNTLLQDGTIQYFLTQVTGMSASLQVDYLLKQDTQYARSRLQQTARALRRYQNLASSQTLNKLLDILPNRSTYTELLQRLSLL